MTYDDADNTHQWVTEVKRIIHKISADSVIITHPNHHALYTEMTQWQTTLKVSVRILEDDRFFCTIDQFKHWASGRKQLRMEYFYRSMRLQHHILMNGKDPEGGQWNYDADNRKKPPKDMLIPPPTTFSPVFSVGLNTQD